MADIISNAGLDAVERVTRDFGITPATGLELIRMLRESQAVIREAVGRLESLVDLPQHEVWQEAASIRDLLTAAINEEKHG